MAEVQWHSIEPAPVVLIAGKEALLAQRALERIVHLSRDRHADLEVHRFLSTEISKSDLLQYTAPSLFGEPRLVIIDEVTRGAEPLINALLEYVKSPEQDVTLVLINRGDQRAKKLLDAVKKSGAPWVNAAEIKTAKAKMTFAMSEFSRARRRVNSDAVKALVDAFGADLMELAAVSTQLMRDTEPEPGQQAGPITLRHVEALTAGRAETTGFAIADACLAGKEREALVLLRQAELSGLSPVAIVATIVRKARQVAQAAIPGATAKSTGMQDWMFRNNAQLARQYSERALASVFESLAAADAAVKGNDRDPMWALQRLIVEISRARRSRA